MQHVTSIRRSRMASMARYWPAETLEFEANSSAWPVQKTEEGVGHAFSRIAFESDPSARFPVSSRTTGQEAWNLAPAWFQDDGLTLSTN